MTTDQSRDGWRGANEMKLAGVAWNLLSKEERLLLLRHCHTITYESIKKHEASLTWDALMQVTQDDLLNVDFSMVLRRDVQPCPKCASPSLTEDR